MVIVMIGAVAAIAAPGWLNSVERTRLTVGGDELYLGMREAQSEAQAKKTTWRFSLRERNGSIEWAAHPNSISPNAAQWKVIESQSIQIDEETTFISSGGIYYVRFDEDGNPHRLGRVTLSGRRFSNNKRCVIVSTLIGAMRKAKDRPTPDPSYRTRDRFCY